MCPISGVCRSTVQVSSETTLQIVAEPIGVKFWRGLGTSEKPTKYNMVFGSGQDDLVLLAAVHFIERPCGSSGDEGPIISLGA